MIQDSSARRRVLLAALVACAPILLASAPASARTSAARVDHAFARAVALGYPGVAVVTQRAGGRVRFLTHGLADRRTQRRWRISDSMRIASVAKTFNGAVVLSLVRAGKLKLGDTVGALLPGALPQADAVTVRQLLQHTGGVPDYTAQPGFATRVTSDPAGPWQPPEIVGLVEGVRLDFTPGTAYRYSNTDNILLGLIVEKVTGRSYADEVRSRIVRPLGLRHTYLAGTLGLPAPFAHGYRRDGRKYTDVSNFINPSGAWASGGIVSTPAELSRFIRALVSGRLYGRALLAEARRSTVAGRGSPPGPGRNRSGLAIFRYRLGCGAVIWGHTGSFPGYRQFAAASADGRSSIVVSANAAPGVSPKADRAMRRAQELASCRVLGR